jgi:hypothetical protein
MSESPSREDLESAIHWWLAEHSTQSIDPSVRNLLSFFFTAIHALDSELRRVPASWSHSRPLGLRSSGKRGTYLAVPPPEQYATLRSILGLAQDIHEISNALKKTVLSGPLNGHASRIEAAVSSFEKARHFFTHLQERLVDRTTHGISGSPPTRCGITYDDTVEAFHLVLSDGVVHFSDYGQPQEVGVMPGDFEPLYSATNQLFRMLTSHTIHPRTYGHPLLTIPTPS